MRIYMANVGAHSGSKGIFSPLFDDGRFEFVPIPSFSEYREPHIVRYRDLRSYNNTDKILLAYVPEKLWNDARHNDPEFETFTYGDVGYNGRSAALTKVQRGDVLAFLARLEGCWANGELTGAAGLYLVGGLHAEYSGWVTWDSLHLARFERNAHHYRGDNEFWGVSGSNQSRRFERAFLLPARSAIKYSGTAKVVRGVGTEILS